MTQLLWNPLGTQPDFTSISGWNLVWLSTNPNSTCFQSRSQPLTLNSGWYQKHDHITYRKYYKYWRSKFPSYLFYIEIHREINFALKFPLGTFVYCLYILFSVFMIYGKWQTKTQPRNKPDFRHILTRFLIQILLNVAK